MVGSYKALLALYNFDTDRYRTAPVPPPDSPRPSSLPPSALPLPSSAMEVEANGFGALPAVLYALDNYHRCLKPAKKTWKYDMALRQIKSYVYLQQEQLNATLAALGLNATTVTTMELREHLRLLYAEEECERFMAALGRMKDLLEDMMVKLDIDAHGKVRTSTIGKPRLAAC